MTVMESLDAVSTVKTVKKVNFADCPEKQESTFGLPSFDTAAQTAYSLDGYLKAFEHAHHGRYEHLNSLVSKIEQDCGGLDQFSRGWEGERGLIAHADGRITYREWAPGASEAFLIGDFNGWNRESHRMKRDQFGVYSIELQPLGENKDWAIAHGSRVKISMMVDGRTDRVERIPAWIWRAEQSKETNLFEGIFWNPHEAPYQRKHSHPARPASLRIYEAHVGICTPEGKVESYTEFKDQILPRVKSLGYNAIQLMAIMEHPYYASFGYQVSSFFAVSSRFGTPDELMELIDTAHGLGIIVLLDVVHSHACKNTLDGLNEFDGTDHCYFHAGPQGQHDLWDSRLFNYGHIEVLRFLLSNLRFYREVYGFDGFRFDGVTSMLYKHHGIATGFSGDYREYFESGAVDGEALAYLQLANLLLHRLYPNVITIAEDVSGMPMLCRPVEELGAGFDLRLAMAVPDLWIKLLKGFRDEDWPLGELVHTLENRRWKEASVAYAESHDQALVGDKTLAFWLMDAEMYTHMSRITPLTPTIDRGMALHKMIRLLTFGLGGESWLCFMGNEFGHPEWLDFPRAGNGNSFHYARRQYNLADDQLLRYSHLGAFDAAMMQLDIQHALLSNGPAYVSSKHEGDKLVAFERAGLLFIVNFHPTQSFVDYRVGLDAAPGTSFELALCSDDPGFGGHGRVEKETSVYWVEGRPHNGRPASLLAYIPSRTALVLMSSKRTD